MKTWRSVAFFVACTTMFATVAIGQDVGKGQNGRTSSGSSKGSGTTAPPRTSSGSQEKSRGGERSTPPAPPRTADLGRGAPTRSTGSDQNNTRGGTPPVKSRGGESTEQSRGIPTRTGGQTVPPPTRGGGDPPVKSRGGESTDQTRGNGIPTKTGGQTVPPPTRGGDPPVKFRGGSSSGFGGYDNDRTPGRPTQDITKITPLRGSGSNAYGTNSNYSNRGQGTHTRVGNVDIYSGPLEYQVRREDRIRIITNGRRGYAHYNPTWCDDWFYSPWYVFDPFRSHCVIGPWYWYPHLPGYISLTRVVYVQVPTYNWGGSYSWNRPGSDWNDSRSSDLDYAIDDLVRGFERADMRLMGRLAPTEGRVNYYFDGQYEYSILAEDFYDMVSDLVEGTQTDDYRILEVRRNRGDATVFAEHVFVDSWGARRSNFHMFRLSEYGRGRYQITDFGTSAQRWKL